MGLGLDPNANANKSVAPNSGTPQMLTLSSTYAYGMCVCFVLTNGTVTGVSGSTLGSFTQRAVAYPGSGDNRIYVFYKSLGSSALSSEVLTISVGGGTGFVAESAWVVSDPVTIGGVTAGNSAGLTFDSGGPQVANGANVGTTPPSITTATANSFVYGGTRVNTSAPGHGTGWTGLMDSLANSFSNTEYKVVTSATTYTLNTNNDANFQQGIIDAIIANPVLQTSSMTSAETVTLGKAATHVKVISYLHAQVVTLARSIFKTITITLSELLTSTQTKHGGGQSKTITTAHAELVSLAGITSNHYSVAGGNIGEIVTLDTPLVSKIILLLSAELLTLGKAATKTISMTSSELVTLFKAGVKLLAMTTGEIVTLFKSAVKPIALANAQIVTLLRGIFKTISVGLSNILTLSATVPSINKSISLTSAQLVTLQKLVAKTILLSISELVFLPRQVAKIISIATSQLMGLIASPPIVVKIISLLQSQLVTLNRGQGSLFFKTVNLLSGQLLKLVSSFIVSREAIKLIPLDFSYHFLSTPETLYVGDSATMFMTPSQPANAISRLSLLITSPAGVIQLRVFPDIWIGPVPSWSQTDPNGITQFLITQFTRGALNKAGIWKVSVLDDGAAIYSSQFSVHI